MPTPTPGAPPNQQDNLQALRAPSAEQRWAAARNLAGHTAATAALVDALAHEHDKRVRAAIFTSLATLNSQESFSAALHHLRGDDAERRGEALEAMKLMPDIALKNLEALLHDSDTDIRILACDLARDLTPPHAARTLASLLRHETNPNVCASAIDALAETGDPQDLASLDACAKRFAGNPFLEFAVRTASQRITSRSRSTPA